MLVCAYLSDDDNNDDDDDDDSDGEAEEASNDLPTRIPAM